MTFVHIPRGVAINKYHAVLVVTRDGDGEPWDNGRRFLVEVSCLDKQHTVISVSAGMISCPEPQRSASHLRRMRDVTHYVSQGQRRSPVGLRTNGTPSKFPFQAFQWHPVTNAARGCGTSVLMVGGSASDAGSRQEVATYLVAGSAA